MSLEKASKMYVFGDFLNRKWQKSLDFPNDKEFLRPQAPRNWEKSSYLLELLSSPVEDNNQLGQKVDEAKKYAFTLLSAVPKIYDLLENSYYGSSHRDVNNLFIEHESLDLGEDLAKPVILRDLLVKIEKYEHLLWKAVQAYKFKARNPKLDERANKLDIVDTLHCYLMEKKINLYRESLEEAYGS